MNESNLNGQHLNGLRISGLQLHLQAQRESAFGLIARQNQLLASMMSGGFSAAVTVALKVIQSPVQNQPMQNMAAVSQADVSQVAEEVLPQTAIPEETQSAVAPSALSVPIKKGNVISLFAYRDDKNQVAEEQVNKKDSSDSSSKDLVKEGSVQQECLVQESLAQEGIVEDDAGCTVFHENDKEAREKFGKTIDELLAVFGGDDALAINRKQMADTIFLNSSKDAIFYHKSADGVMFVTCYVGPEDKYSATLAEIKNNAEANDLLISLMAQDDRVEALKAGGFSTTPIGIWQRVEPLSKFTLGGSKMRRLRYLVSKYKKMGDCKTIEYMPGTTPEVDKDICQVMDQWVELKNANPPFVVTVQKQIMAGELGSDHRFFLTYRNETLDNVIVLSRDNLNNGYLMDLEFYAKGMPLGSTEFALSEIIACFQEEGRNVLSLGLTMGTGLFEHENRSQEVHDLFHQLKKAEYLDGDANAQYKNKYRPTSVTMYIARPTGCGRKKLNDLMLILGSG